MTAVLFRVGLLLVLKADKNPKIDRKIMKRILIALLFTVPVSEIKADSKLFSWATDDVTREMIQNGALAVARDAKNMIMAVPAVSKTLLEGAEKALTTTVAAPFRGLRYVALDCPAVGFVASVGIAALAGRKANELERKRQDHTPQFGLAVASAMTSGCAAMIFAIATLEKYFPK